MSTHCEEHLNWVFLSCGIFCTKSLNSVTVLIWDHPCHHFCMWHVSYMKLINSGKILRWFSACSDHGTILFLIRWFELLLFYTNVRAQIALNIFRVTLLSSSKSVWRSNMISASLHFWPNFSRFEKVFMNIGPFAFCWFDFSSDALFVTEAVLLFFIYGRSTRCVSLESLTLTSWFCWSLSKYFFCLLACNIFTMGFSKPTLTLLHFSYIANSVAQLIESE